MNRPKCCLCGEEIKLNEHYFIFRGGRSVCKKCKERVKHEDNNGGVVLNNCGVNSDRQIKRGRT